MTPQDLRRITTTADRIDPERFATTFYATLFEMAPAARTMFPDDMSEQRRKLMAELTTMIALATSIVDGDMARFEERAHRLGRRHVDYGATAAHYEVVGTALLSTLAAHLESWDAVDERAWTRLYGVISSTMQEPIHLDA